MGKIYLATKNNLIKLQNAIQEYKNGQGLLEQKELILKNKLENYKIEEKKLKEKMNLVFYEAEENLKRAIVDVGIDELIDISHAIKEDNTIGIKYISIMGIEIPSVIFNDLKAELNYGLYHTTSAVDESIIRFRKVKELVIQLAEINKIIIGLQRAIEKIGRRSNALKEIIIPREEKLAKKISLSLEEEERDEFVRLKVVKNNNFF